METMFLVEKGKAKCPCIFLFFFSKKEKIVILGLFAYCWVGNSIFSIEKKKRSFSLGVLVL